MSEKTIKCSVCGITLPNRYAIAGQCAEKGCDAVFCSLHAVSGARCPAHGGGKHVAVKAGSTERKAKDVEGVINPEDLNEVEKEKRGRVMEQVDKGRELAKKASKAAGIRAKDEALKILKKLGSGTKSLISRLKKDRSPEAVLDTMNQQKAENSERRAEVSKRIEDLYETIVQKKQERAKAAAVRKRTLDMELKNLLAEYKGLERQLAVYLENERVIEQVKGRFMECLAYDMRQVDENRIDDIVDDLDERVEDAEATLDAIDDLEKAGRRKDRDSGEFDLDAELDGFGELEEPGDREQEPEARSQESRLRSASVTTPRQVGVGDQEDKEQVKELE